MRKEYFSNCLIEAVKAKIKHGKKITVKHVSAFQNFKRYKIFCPHFYWVDNATGKMFSFHTACKLRFPFWLFFKGHVAPMRGNKER